VVTAEKRETNLQNTPIAIETVSGKDMQAAGVIEPRDLQSIVPALSIQQSGPATPVGCKTVSAGTYNCDGLSLPNTSTWSGNLGYHHTLDLPWGDKLVGAFASKFQTTWYGDFSREPATRQAPYETLDLNGTYQRAGDHWSLTAYVHNATDRLIKWQAVVAPLTPGASYEEFAPPRTFGLRLDAHF
jgi:iron complex outermembrane receptor protein